MSRKTALITGAARGIGLATARLMNQNGYLIAMVDRDEAEIHKVAGEVNGEVVWTLAGHGRTIDPREKPVDGCAARRPRGGVCPRGKPDHA